MRSHGTKYSLCLASLGVSLPHCLPSQLAVKINSVPAETRTPTFTLLFRVPETRGFWGCLVSGALECPALNLVNQKVQNRTCADPWLPSVSRLPEQ